MEERECVSPEGNSDLSVCICVALKRISLVGKSHINYIQYIRDVITYSKSKPLSSRLTRVYVLNEILHKRIKGGTLRMSLECRRRRAKGK